jgi:hypothetical protein
MGYDGMIFVCYEFMIVAQRSGEVTVVYETDWLALECQLQSITSSIVQRSFA